MEKIIEKPQKEYVKLIKATFEILDSEAESNLAIQLEDLLLSQT